MTEDEWMVLAEYDKAAERPGGTRLEEWLARYPQHERALVEYALNSYVFEHGVQYHADTDAIARRFLSGSAGESAKTNQSDVDVARPLASLLGAAREAGLPPVALANRLGVGATLLAKLERRLIRIGTIPRAMLDGLAGALGRSAEEVAAYLGAPATLSPQASYRAVAAPSLRARAGMVAESRGPAGEAFADAVRASRDMTVDQKARWLTATDASDSSDSPSAGA